MEKWPREGKQPSPSEGRYLFADAPREEFGGGKEDRRPAPFVLSTPAADAAPADRFGSLVQDTLRDMETDEEFQLAQRRLKEEEDANQAAQLAAMRRQHKEELQSQIAYNEEMRRRERREYLEEGDRVRANLAAERARLEAIKQRKLEELAASGVPEKYLAELAKKKIAV